MIKYVGIKKSDIWDYNFCDRSIYKVFNNSRCTTLSWLPIKQIAGRELFLCLILCCVSLYCLEGSTSSDKGKLWTEQLGPGVTDGPPIHGLVGEFVTFHFLVTLHRFDVTTPVSHVNVTCHMVYVTRHEICHKILTRQILGCIFI